MSIALSILFALAAICAAACAIVTARLHRRLRNSIRLSYPEVWNEMDTPSRYFDDWGAFSWDAATKFAFDPAYTDKCDEHVRTLAFSFRRWVRIRGVAVGVLLMTGTAYAWLSLR